VDARLPGGGGNVITGLYDVNPNKFGQTDNITTFAKNFGKEVQMWNGAAFTVNARLPHEIILQGGLDTGTITQDVCDIRSKVPEYTAADPYSAPVVARGHEHVDAEPRESACVALPHRTPADAGEAARLVYDSARGGAGQFGASEHSRPGAERVLHRHQLADSAEAGATVVWWLYRTSRSISCRPERSTASG
jgi:hypothetical protein